MLFSKIFSWQDVEHVYNLKNSHICMWTKLLVLLEEYSLKWNYFILLPNGQSRMLSKIHSYRLLFRRFCSLGVFNSQKIFLAENGFHVIHENAQKLANISLCGSYYLSSTHSDVQSLVSLDLQKKEKPNMK